MEGGFSQIQSQMLTVFDDLKSKVAVSSSGFLKFIDILRNYPEYEELANDLQGTYGYMHIYIYIYIYIYIHIAIASTTTIHDVAS